MSEKLTANKGNTMSKVIEDWKGEIPDPLPFKEDPAYKDTTLDEYLGFQGECSYAIFENIRVPQWLLDLPKEKLIILFNSLLDGSRIHTSFSLDGSVKFILCVSYENTKETNLIDAVEEISSKLGIPVERQKPESGRHGPESGRHGEYTILTWEK
jgi:hypothetical protein